MHFGVIVFAQNIYILVSAGENSTAPETRSKIMALATGEFSIRKDAITGNPHLVKEIEQGIEIILLSDGDIQGLEIANLQTVNSTLSIQPFAYLPSGTDTYISTNDDNDRFIEGGWAGGLDGLVIFSRTASTTTDSQGRASVTTSSAYKDGDWRNEWIRSDASLSASASGNIANWDLQGR